MLSNYFKAFYLSHCDVNMCNKSIRLFKSVPFKIGSSFHVRFLNNKKLKVISIWEGMSPKDISKNSNLTLNQIYETMDIYNLQYLNTLDDVKYLVQKLQLRFVVTSNPKIVPTKPKFSFDSLFQAKAVPEGKDFRPRPPVVTIMGHVDHGKTTLLDSLRKSEIVKSEFGGITQHIGAFSVSLSNEVSKQSTKRIGNVVTFLDTPGHAAFSAMRQRGANVTDLVILVIAADDGVMDQTIESIKFAKEAQVPVIIAINKIDRVDNLDESIKRVISQLHVHGIICESQGGDTQVISISALKNQGLDDLKEAILALAETLELKAPYDGGVKGSVIESTVDSHRGKLTTILIEKGTLKKGQIILSGETSLAKVRAMFDEWGNVLDNVTPGFFAQVIGWKEMSIPEAGSSITQFDTESSAKEIIHKFRELQKVAQSEKDSAVIAKILEEQRQAHRKKLESFREGKVPFWKRKCNIERKKERPDNPEDKFKLRLIIKADVHGSLEAILNVVENYPSENSQVKLDLLHYGIGSVTESDIDLATCFSNSIIYAFNVKTLSQSVEVANKKQARIKNFNVIYHLVDDLKSQINTLMPEVEEEEVVGEATVVQEFLINEKRKKVPIAGSKCNKGSLLKTNCFYKLIRGDKVLFNKMEIASMRHFKEEVDSISKGLECGLGFKTKSDYLHFKPGDKIICFRYKKVKLQTKWRPTGF